MEDVRENANNLIGSLLFTVELSRILGIDHTYRVYKVLYPERDCSPTSVGWVDKSNGQLSYDEMKSFIKTYVHQINNNKSLSKLIYIGGNIENPFHIMAKNHHIYSHCHHASLVITVDDEDGSLIKHFKHILDSDFVKIFGYRPKQDNKRQGFKRVSRLHYTIQQDGKQIEKPCILHTHLNKKTRSINLNSKNAIYSYIDYLLTDYHLQTKDCDLGQFKKLNHHQQHLIATSQLASTKGYRGSNMVSKAIATRPVKIVKAMVALASIMTKASNADRVASTFTQIATKNAITAKRAISKHSYTSKHKLAQEKAHIVDELASINGKFCLFNLRSAYTKKADNHNDYDYRTVYLLSNNVNDVHKSYFTGSDVLSMTKSTGIPP